MRPTAVLRCPLPGHSGLNPLCIIDHESNFGGNDLMSEISNALTPIPPTSQDTRDAHITELTLRLENLAVMEAQRLREHEVFHHS